MTVKGKPGVVFELGHLFHTITIFSTLHYTAKNFLFIDIKDIFPLKFR